MRLPQHPPVIGPRIYQIRLKKNWKQEYVAARLGITQAYLSRLENGLQTTRSTLVLRNLEKLEREVFGKVNN